MAKEKVEKAKHNIDNVFEWIAILLIAIDSVAFIFVPETLCNMVALGINGVLTLGLLGIRMVKDGGFDIKKPSIVGILFIIIGVGGLAGIVSIITGLSSDDESVFVTFAWMLIVSVFYYSCKNHLNFDFKKIKVMAIAGAMVCTILCLVYLLSSEEIVAMLAVTSVSAVPFAVLILVVNFLVIGYEDDNSLLGLYLVGVLAASGLVIICNDNIAKYIVVFAVGLVTVFENTNEMAYKRYLIFSCICILLQVNFLKIDTYVKVLLDLVFVIGFLLYVFVVKKQETDIEIYIYELIRKGYGIILGAYAIGRTLYVILTSEYEDKFDIAMDRTIVVQVVIFVLLLIVLYLTLECHSRKSFENRFMCTMVICFSIMIFIYKFDIRYIALGGLIILISCISATNTKFI